MRAFLAMPNVELKSKGRWGLKLIGLGEMLDLYDDVKKTAPPTRSNRIAKGGAKGLTGFGAGAREPLAISRFSNAEIATF